MTDTTEQFHPRKKLEKQRALATARNPLESKFGGALLRIGGQETRMLSNEVGKLEREHKRQQMHIDQAKKQFLQQHQLPEPTLLVVRPPSPELVRKVLYRSTENEEPYYERSARSTPGYMRSVQSKTTTPSLRTTIDIFSMKVRKKRNIWEDALPQKPCFQSAIQPSWPLTRREQDELRKGWELHIRPKTYLCPIEDRLRYSSGKKSGKKKKKLISLTPSGMEVSGDGMESSNAATFITEVRSRSRPASGNTYCSSEPDNFVTGEKPKRQNSILKSSKKLSDNSAVLPTTPKATRFMLKDETSDAYSEQNTNGPDRNQATSEGFAK